MSRSERPRPARRRKSVFAKFEEGEFADISAAYGEESKKARKAVASTPPRSETLSATNPVHKSALPVPQSMSPAKPPRTPAKQGMLSDTPSQPSIGRPAALPGKQRAGSYEPPAFRPGSGERETPTGLLGPNLSATMGSQRSSFTGSQLSALTDSSPFAQSLERRSGHLSDEGPARSGDSTSSTHSHRSLLKKGD